jgi:hypothetical protein
MDWGQIVEKLIREAQAQGKFSRLAGHGRPLKLDQADESAEEWAAHHLLRNNGFRPDWLEEDLALRAEVEQARAALQRSWTWHQSELAALAGRRDLETEQRRSWLFGEWSLAQHRFRETIAANNQRRRTLNLKVPNDRFQRRLVDADAELSALTSAG